MIGCGEAKTEDSVKNRAMLTIFKKKQEGCKGGK